MWRVFSLSLFVAIAVDGWCYRSILCFMVGCHILLFLWAMNWGIEIMAPAVGNFDTPVLYLQLDMDKRVYVG